MAALRATLVGFGGTSSHPTCCPECDRIFDAADPQTYAARESAPTILMWIVQLAVITIFATAASLIAVWLWRTLF